MMKEKFDFVRIDRVEKIDLSNESQFVCLQKFFSRNIETVNFWLNHCVFPVEMQHFSHRMTATSWNLADGRWVVGFSGTNDNHRTLPEQVTQFFVNPANDFDNPELKQIWMSLMSTNGYMLSCILDNTLECLDLGDNSPTDAILDFVKDRNSSIGALIDCGAIFAGAKRKKIAEQILGSIPVQQNSLRGSLFFDDETGWMIVERSGRVLPKGQSPVEEYDCFAFYDEARCRGVDLKLKTTVVAILTLGPRMCKDKFMQAVGRLRKLGKGQKLIIAGTSDVMAQVKKVSKQRNTRDIQAIHVLEWTLRNAIESNSAGILPWCKQGFFHATTYGISDLVVEEEPATLDHLYGGSFRNIDVAEAAIISGQQYVRRLQDSGGKLSDASSRLIESINRRSRKYGNGTVQLVQGTDEECERELELEREVEQEEEVVIPKVQPLVETVWDIKRIFFAQKPSDLPQEARIHLLSDFLNSRLDRNSIDRLRWENRIFATTNFFVTVHSGKLNNFLRIVDTFLYFVDSATVLLLSEQEADTALEMMRHELEDNLRSPKVVLLHLSFARAAVDKKFLGVSPGAMTLAAGLSPYKAMPNKAIFKSKLPSQLLACLQLFAGETVFPSPDLQLAVKKIVEGNKDDALHADPPVEEASKLVQMRGYSHRLDYSDLERICNEISREHEVRSNTGDVSYSDLERICNEISREHEVRSNTGDVSYSDLERICNEISREHEVRSNTGDISMWPLQFKWIDVASSV